MASRAPVHCTWCRAPGIAPVAVLTVVDGPGVRYQEVRAEDAIAGDVCNVCPRCGREKCVRVLPAAS